MSPGQTALLVPTQNVLTTVQIYKVFHPRIHGHVSMTKWAPGWCDVEAQLPGQTLTSAGVTRTQATVRQAIM
ncbi:hypothetical protein E2C01_020847 [Portunus trituberculatus]|uniref:Uncharacterized protein n=1 Tax=Portunus trituberculatus TaxID=210409 RepID=A0A5B7E2P7_PORTR|nr:hypothetical protein [Portunus trituberculatus]